MENLESRIVNVDTLQQKAKKFIDDFKRIVDNKKTNWKIMLWVSILWFLFLIYMVVRLILVILSLNEKTGLLINLDTYDTRLVQANQYAKSLINKDWKISDLINAHSNSTAEIDKYQDHINNLNVPYEYFLQYIYLPHLNIWKDIYTNDIDTNMVWKNFLEKNPYNDILLLQRWSDFFKNVWDNNETNEVKNIKIWDIKENKDRGLFSIPVSLSFESKSKRAFLLLVDKISVTSNKTTLSLINEFFYYLRQEIKTDKKNQILSLQQEYSDRFFHGEDISIDKVVWFHLYNRIFSNFENKLITPDILQRTIRKVSYCDKENNEMCYYKFREKYRDIPTFGYLIGSNSSTDSVANFKKFILSLPPVFSVKQFSFNQTETSSELWAVWRRRYKWNITIDVYGKWMTQWDLDEISKKLWESCYPKEEMRLLSVEEALKSVNEVITSLSDLEKKDTADSSNLRDLKNIVEQISKDYSGYTNYRKVIKLFEIYRMLKNVWLCK